MDFLETKRSLLEDLEIIENAITERIQRNPELYYRYILEAGKLFPDIKQPRPSLVSENKIYKLKKNKRNRKQVILQQHEIDLFLRDYKEKQRLINEINIPQDVQEDEKDLRSFEQKLSLIHI